MRESDYFNEKQETKRATFTCPHCRDHGEYDVRWLRRTKKSAPPRGGNEQDRAQFQSRATIWFAWTTCWPAAVAANVSTFPVHSRSFLFDNPAVVARWLLS